MTPFTIDQWVILFLVLVLGWVLGLLSRSGGRKWRRAYEQERDERAAIEQRHAEALATANSRIAELEKARIAAPVAPSHTAPPPPVAPLAGIAATNAAARARGDDLALIRGIGPVGRDRLAEHGVYGFRDIRSLDGAGKADLERRIGAPAGTIDRDGWQEQAVLLEEGRLDEHHRRFG